MVPALSYEVSRASPYSGFTLECTSFRLRDFHPLSFTFPDNSTIMYLFPRIECPSTPDLSLVWALPLSLATTHRISVDFSSSPYLDVSVQAVPLLTLFDSDKDPWAFPMGVPSFGNLRINGYLHLPAAYRSLSRPSSAPDAKASSLRSY